MFKKVLVGVDGSAGGRDAFALANQLVDEGGEVIQAYVELLPAGKSGTGPATGWHPAREPHANEQDGHSSRRATDGAMLTAAATSVGRGLHLLAEHEHADLMVVGSTRHGLVGRVLMGDDTKESVNAAPCAVAIAPAGYAQHAHKLQSVGVAYNASAESKHAADVARSIASEYHAKLSAMEVVQYPTIMYTSMMVPVGEIVRPLIEEARERLQALGDVDINVKYGDVSEELAHYSGSVDLLVVGSRDYGPLGRLTHSSVSRHLTRSCHCPLLILTKAASVEHATATPNRDASASD